MLVPKLTFEHQISAQGFRDKLFAKGPSKLTGNDRCFCNIFRFVKV